jgi:hypothetical protein
MDRVEVTHDLVKMLNIADDGEKLSLLKTLGMLSLSNTSTFRNNLIIGLPVIP